MQIRYKPEETPASLNAKKSYLGRVYLDWAKYPIVEAEALTGAQSGFIVHFQDLRYSYPEMTGRGTLSASVTLNRNLNVKSESWGSR